jgi:hypothetical protein
MTKLALALCCGLALLTATSVHAQTVGEPTSPPMQAPPPPPDEPPPPPEGGAQPVAPPEDTSGGQWIDTEQYGWVYAPDGDQYSAEAATTEETPYQYVYVPASGWAWINAPWGAYALRGRAVRTHVFHGGGYGVPSGTVRVPDRATGNAESRENGTAGVRASHGGRR